MLGYAGINCSILYGQTDQLKHCSNGVMAAMDKKKDKPIRLALLGLRVLALGEFLRVRPAFRCFLHVHRPLTSWHVRRRVRLEFRRMPR